jgi:uncharacterized repeat protein (TIGR01451 family)
MKIKSKIKSKIPFLYFLAGFLAIAISIIFVNLLSSRTNIFNFLIVFLNKDLLSEKLAFWDWLPLLELLVAAIGLIIYTRIDFLQHRKPLVDENKDIEYDIGHHLKVVLLPKTKYYWKNLSSLSGLALFFVLVLSLSFNLYGQRALAYAPNEFVTTWKTDNPGLTANNQITIPTYSFETYSYNVDWGDSASDSGVTGSITHTYANPGTYTVIITGTFPRFYCNITAECQKLTSIEQWGNNPWTSMEAAFAGASNLTINATDTPNLSSVTNMSSMFARASSFNDSINNWDVGGVTDMGGMFFGASNFNQPLDSWDTANVTVMASMFGETNSFNQPLDSWDVSGVTDMGSMFLRATAFNQPLDSWDVSGVTEMSLMFESASSFNQPLDSWDVSGVIGMESMFNGASSFNQPLDSWDVSGVTSMQSMFRDASSFNQPLDSWDVSGVTSTRVMFYNATAFNQPLDSWDVSGVTDMGSMFNGASSFNQPLDSWDVSGVTDMSLMFESANSFNQPLDTWNVSGVTDIFRIFSFASSFNQPLDSWDVSGVTSMQSMFRDASSFNQPLDSWDVSGVTDMNGMFSNASSFNQPLDTWNVSGVTDMSGMFWNASSFNQPLDSWDVSGVTDMGSMFQGAASFDRSINSWDVSGVTDMGSLFLSASSFNQPLDSWDVSGVIYMQYMFDSASSFNQPLDSWDVSGVIYMTQMFGGATSFNQPLGSWNTGNVTHMDNLFAGASSFNQPLDSWDVSGVTTMFGMFGSASSFNQPLDSWDVSGVTTMFGMFGSASSFNQPLDSWDVSGVTDMSWMFLNNSSFDQPLGNWNVSNVTSMAFMFAGATLSDSNYDTLLTGWSNLSLQNGVSFDGGNSQYCSSESARTKIINDFSWTINDGGLCGSGGGGQTDFSITKTLLTPIPITSGQSVIYHMKITNEGPNDSTYSGYVYDFLPSEFTFNSSTNAEVICTDQGPAENMGDPYFTTHYSGHNLLICAPSSGTYPLLSGENIEFEITGTANSNFILNSTKNKAVYLDQTGSEQSFLINLNNQVMANQDIFLLADNNISVQTYGSSTSPETNPETPPSNGKNSNPSATGINTQNPSAITRNPFLETTISNSSSNSSGNNSGSVPVNISALAFTPEAKEMYKNFFYTSLPKVPYILIILLLLLSTAYLIQAWRSYRLLKAIYTITESLKKTIQSTKAFISITSHYLNTPLTILSSSLELMDIKDQKTDPNMLSNVKSYIGNIRKEIELALSSRNINVEILPNSEHPFFTKDLIAPIKSKLFWTMILLSGLLFSVAQIILYNNSLLSHSGLRVTIEFLIYGSTITMAILTFKYKKFIDKKVNLQTQYLETLTQLSNGQKAFLQSTSANIYFCVANLKKYSDDYTEISTNKPFNNGVNMLLSVCDNTAKVARFSSPEKYNEMTDFSNVVTSTINVFSAKAKAKKMNITSSIASEINTDARIEELRHIVESILDNSVKFGKENGNIHVKLNKKGKNVLLTVKDDGLGIDPGKLDMLFKPFSRATSVEQYNYEGIGLNLYVTKIITEKLGGKIEVSSKDGHGLEMSIEIPCKHYSYINKSSNQNDVVHPTNFQTHSLA